MPIITSFSSLEKKKRATRILERVRVLRKNLQEQRKLWHLFHSEMESLADRLDGISEDLGLDWFDTLGFDMRIEANKKLLEQLEQAVAEGNSVALSSLKQRILSEQLS